MRTSNYSDDFKLDAEHHDLHGAKFGLADWPGCFDIQDHRIVDIDQVARRKS